MKVHNSLAGFKRLRNAVVTSGTFDGVHNGHVKILKRLKQVSRNANGECLVLTFWPHPRLVVSENPELQLLSTIEEKTRKIAEHGIDHLLIVPFTRSFSELSSLEYIREVIVDRIGTKKMVIGYDHRFGRNREGDFAFLKLNCKNFGFDVEEIPKQEIDHVAVSSTRIRKELTEGSLSEANNLLGYPYCFSGTVVKGNQLGRTLGFATANVQVPEPYKLIPKYGVYVVRVQHAGKTLHGMMSIGIRPTIGGGQRTIEVNIFDFDQNIYGENLTVELLAYLRPEEKFDSLETMVSAIQNDKIASLDFLSKTE